MDFPVPENERDRLTALDAYDVIGTPPEADFDEIAEMAADICDCPAFVVHLVGPAEHRFSMTRAKAPGPSVAGLSSEWVGSRQRSFPEKRGVAVSRLMVTPHP